LQGAWETFDRFIEYISEIDQVLNLSIEGINRFQNMPQITKAYMEVKCSEENRQLSEHEQTTLKKLNEVSEQAKHLEESGFPLLYAHSIVALWGALETLIEDLSVSFLINENSNIKRVMVDSLTIPLFQFMELDNEERMRLLLELLEQKLKSRHKPGIARFEAILDVFNLAGDVPEPIKRDLYEMYNVRNVIVHRSSVIDRKLLSNCPWLTGRIGEKFVINDTIYSRYLQAISEYFLILARRTRKYFDHE